MKGLVEGWLKLYRSIQNHWLWEDKPFSRGQAFVDLLLMANHKDNKILFNGELIEIKRGSRITSLRQLSDAWGWSTTKVKKFLELLEKENMITVKSDNKKTLVTIENYGVYQEVGNTEETQEKQQSNTDVTQKKIKKNSEKNQKKTNKNDKERYKNDKERKEGEEEESPPTSPRFYPSPIHELLANSDSLSPVSYKTFFQNADIREEDGVIQIKPENEFSKGAIKKYIPTLEIETHKKIEVI
ncbi:hypothetical protein [Clostridium perfringens]|uniref:hypothetical protein n=1 Tax=Clostridium perfringens TaxID=1502 RepID=UPI0008D9D97F|nr:hypothetical protein [Clostridium perfringens]EJT5934027.1 hypothetical protein [Clostridium perfringens]ELC8347516.1 hypothetical protein [Clostridium perfringens]HBI7336936.1 hypothetical protein [Clostridium perfringens]